MLIDTEDGYRLLRAIRGIIGNDVGSTSSFHHNDRQQSIYNITKENEDVTAKFLSVTLSETMSGNLRTIDEFPP